MHVIVMALLAPLRSAHLRPRSAPMWALALGLALGACAEGTPAPSEGDGSVTDTSGSDVVGGDTTPDPDGSGCLPTACAIGTAVCGGTGAVIECVDDGNGCGTLGDPVACGLSDVCEDGACVPFQTCSDGDGDSYGAGCAAGPDCDDADLAVNPGASELCGDGVDNNCLDGIDEGCVDPCAGQPCLPSERRCSTGGELEECVADGEGCGSWAAPIACPGGGACVGGVCQGCVDGDGDGRGASCPLGDDCDDGNAERFEGNPEVCDDLDNDCDTEVDEDFATKGDACTAGQGACQQSGQLVCATNKTSVVCNAVAGSGTPEQCGDNVDSDCDGNNDNGFGTIGQGCTVGSGMCTSNGSIVCDTSNPRQTVCSAPPPTGSTEICDGQDNNCNGTADDGGVCSSCTEDSHEQNDTSLAATDLTTAKTISSLIVCGSDVDWFHLGTSPVSADVEIQHPTGNNGAGAPFANLNIEFFCGASFCSGLYGTNTRTTFSSGGCCGSGERVTMRVYVEGSNPASGTPYTLIRR